MGRSATALRGLAALAAAAALTGGLAIAAPPATAQGYARDSDAPSRYRGSDGFRGWRDTGNDPYGLERSELDRRSGEYGRGRRQDRREDYGSERWNDPRQSEPMERLERAADQLREALVLMRRHPPSRRRDEALEEARQALIRIQNAMTWAPRASGGGRNAGAGDGRLFGDGSDLPSGRDMDRQGREQFERGFRQGREDERRRRAERQGEGRASGQDRDHYIAVPNYYPDRVPFQRSVIMPDYSRSMDRLLTAAQSLREAVQAMAQQPASQRRNQAMERAREALLETQQAMIELPPELRQR